MDKTKPTLSAVSKWLDHTQASNPADFHAQIAGLPSEITSLSKAVQRLLVHIDCLDLYGLDPDFVALDRATLPVRERLSKLTARDLVLAQGRPPERRQVATCRDFALLFCSFLRVHNTPARVRCGFASYFGKGWCDHWICELWDAETANWLRADAELDETICEAYGITFDTLDMPPGAFLTASEAWLACRRQRVSPDAFGHGEQRGLWFMGVNLARDSLSLNGREMSAWDSWREAPPAVRHLTADEQLRLDDLARHPERLPEPQLPPWLTPTTISRKSD